MTARGRTAATTSGSWRAVVDALVEVCPWVDPVRPGVCTLAVRGPARYFGGEAAVLARVAEAVGRVDGGAVPAGWGWPRGSSPPAWRPGPGRWCPPGATAAFLAPWPVAVLGTPELAELLPRLGLRTLGALAALPAGDVLARFGAAGARCQRVARGAWRASCPGAAPGPGGPAAAPCSRGRRSRNLQPGFWGGAGPATSGRPRR